MKTNSNNINNSKSNKTKSIIALTSLIIVLSIVNITLLTGTIFGININTTTNASALSYSTNEDISFTFAPTLSIGLSTNSLTIDNLVPGTTNDSNTVTVTVSSNTPYGYVLSAGVGSNDTTSPYYNTSSLTHENSTISNVFSSVDTNASLDSLDTDNTWGYSTSTNGGTSWSTYSGLSHTTTKPLLDISDPATPSTIDFKIAARSATTQASGTYNNVITFYAVGKPEPPRYLYDEVAKMSKGTQTLAQLQATITAPTTTDYTTDTSNSGVYEYDSSVFGEASDASNANKIYYYRGILEPEADQGSYYGSDGKATTYPNYVKLGNDTCWRIVRTTGSGGVKMIYNGEWTGSTCANAQVNAQVGTSTFNGTSSTYRQMVRVGYTYNSTYATNTARSGTIAKIFGTNSTSSVNDTRSDIKAYIEDTWYANNMTAYTSILEPSAGYCNDRTMNTSSGWTTPLAESSTIVTYGTSALQAYYFGAYPRNMNTAQKPSLTCAKYRNVNRSIVDLYRYNGINNAAGSTTANYLKYPAALLTADELSFAGSGSVSATNGSSYHANSYLCSGSNFWLLSPYYRSSDGLARELYLFSNGYLHFDVVNRTNGVRPSISLKPGTEYTSGSGIATDPWVVPAP